MYGLDNKATREYGTRCLLARRLVERGVRFVQLFLAASRGTRTARTPPRRRTSAGEPTSRAPPWCGIWPNAACSIRRSCSGRASSAGCRSRKDKDGRDHNRHAFSLWLAGGGFRRGYVHGRTDDFGYQSVENIVTVHDLHATLLAALGLDHRRLTLPPRRPRGQPDRQRSHESPRGAGAVCVTREYFSSGRQENRKGV